MNIITKSVRKGRPPMVRQSVDHGTDELRLKRQMLVGNADPALSENPLGILFARGVIDQDQRNAGDEYARTYGMAIGRKRELGLDIAGKDDIADDTLIQIEARHRRAQNALRRCGGHTMRLVEEVCVYRILRPWLVPVHGSTAGRDDRHWLLLGLRELVSLQTTKRAA